MQMDIQENVMISIQWLLTHKTEIDCWLITTAACHYLLSVAFHAIQKIKREKLGLL